MYITEWFDIENSEHLLAYQHLSKTGFWPVNFISLDIQFQTNWQIILQSRIADRYVREKLKEITQ